MPNKNNRPGGLVLGCHNPRTGESQVGILPTRAQFAERLSRAFIPFGVQRTYTYHGDGNERLDAAKHERAVNSLLESTETTCERGVV